MSRIKTGEHYGGESNTYEAIKVINAWQLNFSLGNALKYICRAGKKSIADPIEDLEKAAQYLQFEIEERKKKAAGQIEVRDGVITVPRQTEYCVVAVLTQGPTDFVGQNKSVFALGLNGDGLEIGDVLSVEGNNRHEKYTHLIEIVGQPKLDTVHLCHFYEVKTYGATSEISVHSLRLGAKLRLIPHLRNYSDGVDRSNTGISEPKIVDFEMKMPADITEQAFHHQCAICKTRHFSTVKGLEKHWQEDHSKELAELSGRPENNPEISSSYELMREEKFGIKVTKEEMDYYRKHSKLPDTIKQPVINITCKSCNRKFTDLEAYNNHFCGLTNI